MAKPTHIAVRSRSKTFRRAGHTFDGAWHKFALDKLGGRTRSKSPGPLPRPMMSDAEALAAILGEPMLQTHVGDEASVDELCKDTPPPTMSEHEKLRASHEAALDHIKSLREELDELRAQFRSAMNAGKGGRSTPP